MRRRVHVGHDLLRPRRSDGTVDAYLRVVRKGARGRERGVRATFGCCTVRRWSVDGGVAGREQVSHAGDWARMVEEYGLRWSFGTPVSEPPGGPDTLRTEAPVERVEQDSRRARLGWVEWLR